MSSKRVIGKLNTRTEDGRMIESLYIGEDRIPVVTRDRDDFSTLIVGTAAVVVDGDLVIADIDFRYKRKEDWSGPETIVTKYEDLTPHMEILAQDADVDTGDDGAITFRNAALRAVFLDDKPDAFGDLS